MYERELAMVNATATAQSAYNQMIGADATAPQSAIQESMAGIEHRIKLLAEYINALSLRLDCISIPSTPRTEKDKAPSVAPSVRCAFAGRLDGYGDQLFVLSENLRDQLDRLQL